MPGARGAPRIVVRQANARCLVPRSAATIRRAIGAPPRPTEELDLQTTATAVRAHVDEDAFAAAWVSGEALSQRGAIAEALAFLLKPGDAVAELPAQSQHVLPAQAATSATFDLTRRERDVLGLLCQHLSDAEIATGSTSASAPSSSTSPTSSASWRSKIVATRLLSPLG